MAKEKKSVATAIIIPTCALDHVENHIVTVFKNTSRNSVIILSINPTDPDTAEASMETVRAVKRYIEERYLKNIDVVELWHDGPLGFGEACNKGYEHLIENYKDFKAVIFLNDDVKTPQHWDQKLSGALHAGYYTTHHCASTALQTGEAKFFDVGDLGMKIGMSGPMSNFVAGEQRIEVPPGTNYEIFAKEMEHRAVHYLHSEREGEISANAYYTRIHTSFLSGMCLACAPEMLVQRYDEKGFIFDPRYKIGGFEDNDICAWAAINGWCCLIDSATYVEHSGSKTLTSQFSNQESGMRNWSVYFDHWKEYTQRDQKIIGAYRVAFPNINSLAQMGSSLRINIPKLDGLAVLLTANPAAALSSYDGALFARLHPQDQDFLKGCEEAETPEDIRKLFLEWIEFYSPDDYPIEVELWDFDLPLNERDERNRVYEMATSMDADWVFSIDSDECFEDRIERSDLDRLVKNPDPLVTGYAVGWINHYESMNLVRHDFPYADGYRAGMNGVRLWRVYHGHHMPIRAGNNIGLHCGNAPEWGSYGLKGTTLRFRHLSMVREIDRKSKVNYYNNLDQDRNFSVIGGTNYFHIGRSEKVDLTMYNPKNGVGSFVLAYEGENDVLLCKTIWQNHTFSDEQIIVWTGAWEESDEEWMDKDVSEFPSEEDWRSHYPTGPSWMLAVASKLHDVIWLKRSIAEGLAECRNAALEYFETNSIHRIGWAFYLDPDEQFEGGIHHTDFACSLRRMAESTDSWAFRFKFKNPTQLQNGKQYMSPSEALRLIRVDRGLKLRFGGKVHETIEARMNELRQQGAVPIVNECPISFINVGLYKNSEGMKNKFRKYTKLLADILKENPYSSSAWSSLGLTYEQDGKEKEAEICYERACLVAGQAYLPYKLLGGLYARMAMGLFYKGAENSRNAPECHDSLMEKFKYLYENVGEFPKIECGGYRSTDEIELPEFPYEEIQYDDKMNQIVIRKEDSNENLDRNIGA